MPDQPLSSTTNWLIEQHLLEQLRRHGPLSRTDLTSRTGLPRTSVVNAMLQLIQRGLVGDVSDGSRARTVGRPAHLLNLVEPADVLVLELRRTGTQLSYKRSGAIHRRDLAVDIQTGFPVILEAVISALEALGFDDRRRPACLVIAVPVAVNIGPIDGPLSTPPGVPRAPVPPRWPLPTWPEEDAAEFLQHLFGCPVIIENDANLATVGEAFAGAGIGAAAMMHIVIREGLGSGFVIDGTLMRGANGIAGELAHVSVDENGEQCKCGNRGCLVTFGSGPFLVDTIERLYGQPLTFPDIELLAQQHDPPVQRILGDFGRRLGGPVAVIAGMLNLDAVVIDAQLGAAAPSIANGIREVLRQRMTPITYRGVAVEVGTQHAAIAEGGFRVAGDMLFGMQR